MIVNQTFRYESGALATGVAVDVIERDDGTIVASTVTSQFGLATVDVPPGEYSWMLAGIEVPFDVVAPAFVSDPGAVENHTPGTSPWSYTAPAGEMRQVVVSGGSGVSTSINGTLFIGGTGVTAVLMPGETITVAWSTVPSAIRSRRLARINS